MKEKEPTKKMNTLLIYVIEADMSSSDLRIFADTVGNMIFMIDEGAFPIALYSQGIIHDEDRNDFVRKIRDKIKKEWER